MATLGEDLALLAIDPRTGSVRGRRRLRVGLMGAELAVLADAGRIDAASGRIVLTGPAELTTGDQDLDAALAGLSAARRPPRPASWVGRPRRNIAGAYLNRLAADGVVRREGGALRARWPIADRSRASAARARVDAVALRPPQHDLALAGAAQTALAGLVFATGLSRRLYPGWGNRAVRGRLRQIANGQWTARAVHRAIAEAESGG